MPPEHPEISFSTFDWSLLKPTTLPKAKTAEEFVARARASHQSRHVPAQIRALEWLRLWYPDLASGLVEHVRKRFGSLAALNQLDVPGKLSGNAAHYLDRLLEPLAGDIVLDWARDARDSGKTGGSELGPPGQR